MKIVAPQIVGFSPSRLDHIRTLMQSYVDKGKLPGAVTLIARRGQVVHAECVGMRDIGARKPMRLDTLFPGGVVRAPDDLPLVAEPCSHLL
jgi:CubicO group peptidase (beta-lactamase class C family)